MRRAEMARRRKNLSEKRNEEEKVRCLGVAFFSLALAARCSWNCTKIPVMEKNFLSFTYKHPY